jgi:hypothetical protein
VQKLNALIGLGRYAEARAAAPEALAWALRFDALDIHSVLAQLFAMQGELRSAALFLGHYRHSLTRRGADLPLDAHAPWRAAQSALDDALDAATLQGLTERGARLEPAELQALVSGETAA